MAATLRPGTARLLNIFQRSTLRENVILSHVATVTRTLATVRYSERGDPEKVLRLDGDDDIGNLEPGEVAVRMLFAPINPSDINQIEGTYGLLPPMPAVAGNEGVGEVIAVGTSVKSLMPGDRVIPMPAAGFGTWRILAKAQESILQKCPGDIPAEYAASIGVNPCTALRLLKDFVELKEGDTIIQNGANSQVGLAVVQMARDIGVRTINVVRERPPEDHSAQLVKALGGDLVITPALLASPDAYARVSAGLKPPELGLNCTGGSIAAGVAGVLAPGGRLVSYGGMSMQPLTLPAALVQERGIICQGFWVTRWAKENPRHVREQMIEDISQMIRSDRLKLFLERHPLSQFREAMQSSRQPFRSRKVLIDMSR